MPGCRSKVSPLAPFTWPSALWTRQQLYSDAEQNIRDKAARKTSSRLDFTRTLRPWIDLWWERKPTRQPEQIALTCAARQKISFKNGQYGLASSRAAAFTRPSSTEHFTAPLDHVLVGMAWCTFPFFPLIGNLYPQSPAEDGACVRCNNWNFLYLSWGKTSAIWSVSRLFLRNASVQR